MLGRLAREPLLQFLLGGALLFALDAALSARRGPGPDDAVIRLSPAQRAQLLAQAPDGGLQQAIDDFVREEVLVREARALGLDREDAQERRRLAQKLEFVLAEGAEVKEPTADEVRAFFDRSADRYRPPATMSLTQLFFSRAARGERAEADAALALAQPDAAAGDPLFVPRELSGQSALELTAAFGGSFASRVAALPVGAWHGPIASTHGIHLVKVTARIQGEVPTFEAVEARVREDLLEQRRREAEGAALARLRARYRVEGAGAP